VAGVLVATIGSVRLSPVGIFLQTGRLTLRRFTEADEDSLFDLNSDPEVMRFISGGTSTPRAEIRDSVLPFHFSCYEQFEGFGTWAAVEKATGQFLGWFHLRPRKADGAIELGYRLRRSAWGKGYATEGSRALIGKGFTEFGVDRVVAETMAANHASRRVMEKSGLTLVRTFTYHEPHVVKGPAVEYALTRTDWEAQRG
jgi:RimJ/RimL family protein N-acetyltransferase